MTSSMTGFARAEAETDFGTLAWEVRTVNHRHLEISLRMPEECRVLEPRVREAVAAKVRRGKVDLALFLRRRDARVDALELDEDLLAQLVEATGRVARRIGTATPPSAVDLLRWPGVVREAERELGPLHDAAMQLLDTALDDLRESRAREGERIETLLREKAAAIAKEVESVRVRMPEVLARVRDRLTARVRELVESPDPQRLEQELAIIAQRLDVAEELDRLAGHVEEFEAALARDEPVGRRLDFLLQEFNREANTLASKAQDAETTRAAVELKVLIEQVREQVQNLE